MNGTTLEWGKREAEDRRGGRNRSRGKRKADGRN